MSGQPRPVRPFRLAALWVLPLALLAPPLRSQQLSPELQRAFDLASEGNYGDAIGVLESLADSESFDGPARGMLGALYLEVDRPLDAARTLAPLLEVENADPAVLYNGGRAALALGRLPEAEQLFERSVARVPGSPAARELGILRARRGNFLDAYVQLRPWARTHPDDAQARIIAALCAIQLERAPAAEELLSDLPQDQPQIRLLWGKLLMLKADAWGAVSTLKPLLDSAPPAMELDVRRSLAEAYVEIGEATSAVELLAGRVGDDPAAALQLGLAQYQSGDLDAAVATLQPAAERMLATAEGGTPPRPGVETSIVVEYGRMLATAGRHQDSLPYLELASRIAPDRKQVWHQLGQALAVVGRREEAKVALDRFKEIVQNEVPAALDDVDLEKSREDPTGLELRKAMTALSQGDTERALAIARREMQLAPGDIRPRLLEVRVLVVAGRLDEAAEAVEQIVAAAPQSADAVYLRGTVLMSQGDFAAAERDLRLALDLSTDHTAAMNDLAVLLMEKGERAEARALLERALELRPGDGLAAGNLERLKAEE